MALIRARPECFKTVDILYESAKRRLIFISNLLLRLIFFSWLETCLLEVNLNNNVRGMEMKKLKMWLISSAFILGTVATSAEANVIYNWHDVSSDSEVGLISASIEFDESIWSLGGSFFYESRRVIKEYFGVASINFATPLNTSGGYMPGFSDPIILEAKPCVTGAYCATSGDMEIGKVYVSYGIWDFDLTFGELLEGSMYLNDIHSDVRMSSQGSLFTINELGSDSPGLCFWSIQCTGGTGYWKLDHSTVPVSEPRSAWLLAVGLISLAATQRRRSIKRKASDR